MLQSPGSGTRPLRRAWLALGLTVAAWAAAPAASAQTGGAGGLFDFGPDAAPPPGAAARRAGGSDLVPGLIVETFGSSAFDRPTGTRVAPTVDVRVARGTNPPAAGGGGGPLPVAVRWRGMLKVPEPGRYQFRLTAPAKVTVTLAERVVVFAGGPPPTVFTATPVDLLASSYDLRVEASEITAGPAGTRLELTWMREGGFAWEPVPGSALGHKPVPPPGGLPPAVAVAPPSPPADGAMGDPDAGTAPPATRRAKPRPPGGSGPSTEPAKPKAPPSPVPLAKGELAIPDAAAQAEATKKVRARHATYYADTKPVVRQQLAKLLLKEAGGGVGALAPAERYVVLKEAAEVAVAAGDVKAGIEAVQAAVAAFAIDEATFATTALGPVVGKSGRTPAQAAELSDALLAMAARALAGGSADAAAKAGDLAATAARPSPAAAARAKARADRLRDVRAEFAKLAGAAAKLKANPADADANTRMGKYTALLANNWADGLPLLAKGADTELRVLAEREQQSPADADGRVSLGDAWWDRAKQEKEPYAGGCRERAAGWYRLAMADRDLAVATRDRIGDQVVAAGTVVDLLALTDPRRDAGKGAWRFAGRDLFCEGRGDNTLRFPFQPRGEYDFAIEFTATAGDVRVFHMFPGDASTVTWGMDVSGMRLLWVSSPPPFNGRSGGVTAHAAGVAGRQRHTSVVRVRDDRVQVVVDGKVTGEWFTDPTKTKGVPDWQLPDPAAVGVGCQRTSILVHSAKLLEAAK